MAYFYLGKVFHLRKASDPDAKMVGTEATLRYVMDDYELVNEQGVVSKTIPFPRPKYQGFPIAIQYADGDRANNILPTLALMRTEQPLEAGDFNVDLQTKGAAYWTGMYNQYPELAAHPFVDAPYQP